LTHLPPSPDVFAPTGEPVERGKGRGPCIPRLKARAFWPFSVIIKKGILPFRGIAPKLTRADIEWLLSEHEGKKGPVDLKNKADRKRSGLDLRGADLSGVDLRGLPLSRTIGSLTWEEWGTANRNQRDWAAIRLCRANLQDAHFEGSIFVQAHLDGAFLKNAFLEDADFRRAEMQLVYLRGVQLEGVKFRGQICGRRAQAMQILIKRTFARLDYMKQILQELRL
jgi:hypothetical protein